MQAYAISRGGNEVLSGALASGVCDAKLAMENNRLRAEAQELRARYARLEAISRDKRRARMEVIRRNVEDNAKEAKRMQRRVPAWAAGAGFAVGVAGGWLWWWLSVLTL
jgi:ferric-dicitrate binding protein FerR (iron transport regulator)